MAASSARQDWGVEPVLHLVDVRHWRQCRRMDDVTRDYLFRGAPVRATVSAACQCLAQPVGLVFRGRLSGHAAWLGRAHHDNGFPARAYLVGSTCGRRRLFERISPKKSWEGFVGGVACCLIAAAVAWACQVAPREFFGLASWLVLAATVSIVATLGDLLESLLKRTAGVKDSGNLIPGHGGVLDRIDSLLMVLPAVYVLFSLISML